MEHGTPSRADSAALLRQSALARQATLPAADGTDSTLQELRLHQIELEMQNDELGRVHTVLEASRQRYFELYDQAPVGYCTVSDQGLLQEANVRASELLGIPSQDLVSQPLARFIQREDQDAYYLARRALFETGRPETLEVRLRHVHRITWAQLTMTLTQSDDGNPACRLILEDISARKTAERELEKHHDQLDITLRSISDGVITTDERGLIVLMNRAAERLSGWTQAESQGKSVDTVFSTIDEMSRLPRRSIGLEVLESGESTEESSQVLLQSRTGLLRNISDSASPIRDRGGAVRGMVLVFHDVTEQVRMQELVQHTEKIDSLGVLAGGIAHDFNNLLGGVFGYISLAKESLPDQTATLEYLNKASSVFHRAKALTLQLMTFSKGGPPERTTARLAPLLRGAATFVLNNSHVLCDFSLSEDLCLCDFDAHQMSQVFTNLLLNAKEAMPIGGSVRISAHNTVLKEGVFPCLPTGVYLKVTVADQGEGIPHHLFKNVFDPFFTTKKNNQGLGLPTCRSIVQKHGGAIEVQSEPGEGTAIHVYLPASLQELVLDRPIQPVPRAGGTILIMDDEDYMREILREMLKGLGYGVIEAESGEAALRLCAAGQVLRAAFLDLTIRDGMGGRETLVALREVMPDLPVFAASGFSEDSIMAQPQEFGFTAAISKPFKKDELADLLARHLKGCPPSPS